MSRRLDEDLHALRAAPAPAELDHLEGRVWREIAVLRDSRATATLFLPVRAAAIAAALGLGIAGGSLTAAATAAESPEISAFSLKSHLAPSTLLEGHK